MKNPLVKGMENLFVVSVAESSSLMLNNSNVGALNASIMEITSRYKALYHELE
jgi:hypothetical protein